MPVCTDLDAPAVARPRVPLVTGPVVDYANLDHAASAPCLNSVRNAVDEFLPWYASVHRGAGFASQVSTKVYERARRVVRRFVDTRESDEVIFTRNTTDALNLLAHSLPPRTSVVLFDTEHHAALLPWPAETTHRIATPRTRAEAITEVDRVLAACPDGPRLVVLAGASNVTGEVFPIPEIAAVARRHGARIALDAAQWAPHRPISLRRLDVDYVALSGHKIYAPFGAGALIGRADWLSAALPYLNGGGATRTVTESGVVWHSGPERHEAGSPNTIGVYALSVACETLAATWDSVIEHETGLLARLEEGLSSVPGLTPLRLFDDDGERTGTLSFVLDGFDPGLLAAALSAEYGIGVRDGAFCAHIATRRLIARVGGDGTAAVRASLGLGTTAAHVDRLISALHHLAERGPGWAYARSNGRWAPTPDPRELPSFLAA
jgi:selenocysteine lyase/cysteine desulfurase